MAQMSPLLEYILSRPSFKGPGAVPGFNLNAPFTDPNAAPKDQEQSPQDQLMNDQYPSWLALYLGSGDAARGMAIMDKAKS